MFEKKGLKISIFIVLILAAGSFYFGYLFAKNQVPAQPPDLPPGVDFSLLWEIWDSLKEKYPEPIDSQKMIYGAASGMAESLGDPYTVFFNPEESVMFENDISGFFEGVGMEIGIKDGMLTVIAPLKNTPAEKAGLRAGDIILKIGETIASDITIEQAVDMIRGEKGTEVILTLTREGWDAPKEIAVIRDVIRVPTLEWEIKEGNIAYIKLFQFSQTVNEDFKQMSSQITKSGADRIILDLRNNPGGLLDKAQDIAGWFLKYGDLVAIEDFGGKRKQIQYFSYGNETFSDYPIVILINQGSASAAEILAAALKENRGVMLIGEKSFGKGTVQEPISLKGGSILKITVGKWLTPNGSSITDIGLTPDIEIKITEEDYKNNLDPQLDKAIEAIKNL